MRHTVRNLPGSVLLIGLMSLGFCACGGTTHSNVGGTSVGGASASGGTSQSGGTAATGGVKGSGGVPGTGDGSTAGSAGRSSATAGSVSGGSTATTGGGKGGSNSGGSRAAGGSTGSGNGTGSGGSSGSGGAVDAGPRDAAVDIDSSTGRDAGPRDLAADINSSGGRDTGGSGSGGAGGGATNAKPTAGCGITKFPASGSYTIDVSGTSRSYIIKVPTGFDNTKPYRLVMTWHGLGMTADMTANGSFPANEGHYYGLEPISGGQAIFTSGQGLGSSGQTGWPNTNDQDVAFARALVTYLSSTYCIDSSRIFSVGKSYGGNFSNILGCEMGDVFRAIAPQSSWLGGTVGSCKGQVAVWISHGKTDPTITFSRGEAARDSWLKANHCGTTTTPWNATDTQNNCVAYEGCDADKPVIWCPFDGVHEIKDWGPAAVWKFLMQF